MALDISSMVELREFSSFTVPQGSEGILVWCLIRSQSFSRYVALSRMTVLFPLSAGMIMIELSCFKAFMAAQSSGERLDSGFTGPEYSFP